MQKIFKLFTENSTKSFIRVFVFDDLIDVHNIKNGAMYQRLSFDYQDNQKVFAYLKNNFRLPVEIIIGSRSMTCKSISSKKITTKDIRALAENTLSYKKDSINTVFYGKKKLINKTEQISVCDANIDSGIAQLIQHLLMIKNVIRCVTAWPVWIVSSYFNMFNDDENKFSCSLFVLKNEDSWEIIGCNLGEFVCYRQGSSKFFNKKLEIENTIKYLSQMHKISPDNIAIYAINDEVISSFVQYSNQNMAMLSKVIDSKCLPLNYNINKISKVSLFSVSAIFALVILSDLKEVNSIGKELSDSHKILNSLDKKVVDEEKLWLEISKVDIKRCDFKEVLRSYIANAGGKILQSVSLEIDKETGEPSVVRAIPSEDF